MPSRKQTGTTVRISPEHHKLFRKLTARMKASGKGQTQTDLLEFLLDLCDVNNLLNEGWMDRLTASLERGKREIELRKFNDDPNRCEALANGVEKYKCVWGRKGKPPQIRVLESEYEASIELCLRCRKTILMKEEFADLVLKNVNLEKRLKAKAEVSYKIPICNKGAILNEDGTEFSNCPKHPRENVSVSAFCKVYSNGLPCALYAERVIGVADSESEYGSEISN